MPGKVGALLSDIDILNSTTSRRDIFTGYRQLLLGHIQPLDIGTRLGTHIGQILYCRLDIAQRRPRTRRGGDRRAR